MGRQLNMSGILDVLWWCLLEVSSSTLPWTLMSWGTVIPQVILPEINFADSQGVISLCVCLAPEPLMSHMNCWGFFYGGLFRWGYRFIFVLFFFFIPKKISVWFYIIFCPDTILRFSVSIFFNIWGEMRGFTGNCTKTRMQQYNILPEEQR